MKVSVVGASGYSGLELIRILHNHSEVDLISIHGRQRIGSFIGELYPHLASLPLKIEAIDPEKIMENADLVFFATPSGISKEAAQPFITADFPVIDLSGDYRLPAADYQKWYGKTPAETGLEKAHYGLAEFNPLQGNLVANPGCYATAALLALAPLAQQGKLTAVPIIDAKSGLSGAGKTPSQTTHFSETNENVTMYKANQHQHIPEIMQQLKRWQPNCPMIQFTTSLIPVTRGIFLSAYVQLEEDPLEIYQLYQEIYQDKPFVQLRAYGTLPNLKSVIGSNQTAIGLTYNEMTNVMTIVAVLDNLVKGAAGQAVQNMNLLAGFSETAGLDLIPVYP